MGNKFGSCGCRNETAARGYGYSPYSKQMSRNLVRFWAEVFLLAQEGQSVDTKWQMVVAKLVPVNVARVQDTPTVISHVTAYNTKVDKVMDTLIFHPGIEVYRGSECFIYWSDPQKGLTWGLNFITPDDAAYFIDIVSGGTSGLMCRRANSTQSLATKQSRSSKLRSTSSPGTPESTSAHGSRKHHGGGGSGRTQSVKFADAPTICEASPSSVESPNMMNTSVADSSTAAVAHPYGVCDGGLQQQTDPYYARQPPNVAIVANFEGAYGGSPQPQMASSSSSSSQVIVHLPTCARNRAALHAASGYDDLENAFASSSARSSDDRQQPRDREAIWKRLDSIAAATEALEPMRMSLDSSSLKKMLDPLLPHDKSPKQSATVGTSSPHGSPRSQPTSTVAAAVDRRPVPTPTVEPTDSTKYTKRDLDDGRGGQYDVVLRQNDRQVPVVTTPSLKRSSIHLVASKNGRLRSATATSGGSVDQPPEEEEPTSVERPIERAFAAVHDDENSMSSSLDGSTTSQPVAASSSAGQAPKKVEKAADKIRRSGQISMKQWIASKDQQIQILTNATWQQYWCCIKGYSLCFYAITSTQGDGGSSASCCDPNKGPRKSPLRGREGHGIEEMKLSGDPVLTVDLLNCLAQAVPEYPRRQHVFCVSTGFGHVHLLQVTSENELDSWIQALHTFSGLASARTQNREAVARSLRKEIEKMEEKIETVAKLIKLSQLPSVGAVSLHQVGDWENESELLHLQHFMAKAYLAAIKGQEMPSCKKVLAAATSNTKTYLSHLSAFTLSAMHAYVFAKSTPKSVASNDPSPQHGTTPAAASSSSKSGAIDSESNQQTVVDQMARSSSSSSDIYSGIVDCTAASSSSRSNLAAVFKSRASLVQITLPNNQVTVISVTDMDSVATCLQKACDKAGLRPERCFMLLRRVTAPGESYVPDDMELLQPKIATHQVEIRERLVYHVHLSRNETADRIFGLTIRAQKQLARGRLNVFVSNVDENGLAKRAGLLVGDEVLMVNGECVKSLNSQQIERILQDSQCLCLVMRTKRAALPVCLEPVSCDSSTESLRPSCTGSGGVSTGGPMASGSGIGGGGGGTCPLKTGGGGGTAGQKQLGLIDEDEEEAENWFSDTCGLLHQQMEHHKVKYRSGYRSSLNAHGRQRYSLPVIPTTVAFTQLLQRESTSANASPRHLEQRYSLVGNLEKRISSSEPGDMSTGAVAAALRTTSGKLGPSERLEKVLFELVETDRAYVEGMDSMMRVYLEPLRERRLLPAAPLDQLIEASSSVARFQRSFLEELQEAAGYEPPNVGLSYAAPSHLRSALLRVGGLFLNTAARFRLYSSFCAAYFRMQKILKAEEQNTQLQQFLIDCNVHRQHSATLESYLIKPVQRVLRYPLFLQQMKSLTSQGTPEHLQIQEALTKMEKVAEYINEMQRVYEEYGNVFNQIQTQCQQSREKLSLELSDLLMFGEVGWLNAGEESGKKRSSSGNGPVDCVCFVFKSAIVLLMTEKGKGKKSKNNHQNSDKPPTFRLIPVSEIEINGSDVGSTENHYIWILIHIDPLLRTEKVYHFANRRKDIKQQFLRAIRKAGLLLAKESSNGGGSIPIRANKSSSALIDSRRNGGGGTAIKPTPYEDDGADLSSPDSGFPQIASTSLSSSMVNGNGAGASTVSLRTMTNGVGARKETNGLNGLRHHHHQPPTAQSQNGQRPMSYNSSQSDPGYGSNSEKKEQQQRQANGGVQFAHMNNNNHHQSNGLNGNSNHVIR